LRVPAALLASHLPRLASLNFRPRRRVQEEEDQSLSFLGERMESMRPDGAFRVGLPGGGIPHDGVRRMVCHLPYASYPWMGPVLRGRSRRVAPVVGARGRAPRVAATSPQLAADRKTGCARSSKEAGSNLSVIFPRGHVRPHDIEDAYHTGSYTLPEFSA